MRTCLLAALVWLLPHAALALDEGEASLAGGLGPAWASPGNRHGVEGAARLLRGITDSWAGRLSVAVAYLPSSGTRSAAVVTTQTVGLTWSFDVIHWVPFADLGLVAADLRGGGEASQHVGAQAGLGLTYLFSRHLGTTLLAHGDYFALRLAGTRRARWAAGSVALSLQYLF